MLLRIAGVVELGTDDDMSVQVDPFQCSMRTPADVPLLSVVAPEAQQSVGTGAAQAVEVPAARAGIDGARGHRPRRAVPMLDQPLVTHRAREDGEEVGVLWHGTGVAHRPAVVGGEAPHGGEPIVGLAGGGARDDAPDRAVPLLDHVVETVAVLVRRVPDGEAAGGRRAAHALQERTPDSGPRSGSGSARRTRRCRSSSRSGSLTGPRSRRHRRSPPPPSSRTRSRTTRRTARRLGRSGSGGWAASTQAVPFQVSTIGENVPLELMFTMEIPTPQHWVALGHDDPSRMSSAPVPGVVATYQPEGDAAPPSGETMPTAETTSAVKAAGQGQSPGRPGRFVGHSTCPRARRAIIGQWLHGLLPRQRMVDACPRVTRPA